MPIINVQILQGRPEEKIRRVIENVTETVSATLEVPKGTVRVIVTEIPKTHWGVGGVPMAEKQGK